MTKNSFKLTIETPEGTLLKEVDVNNIKFQAEDGMLQVFANHASFMTSLKYSSVEVTYTETNTDTYLARTGIFNFNNRANTGTLVVEYCQLKSEIKPEVIQDYLNYIQDQLAKGNDLSQVQLVYLENEKFAIKKMSETITQ
jgi:F0F1-type ATP synthase epsilon subunit